MASLASLLLRRFFSGTNYYALGRKITSPEGRVDVAYSPVMLPPDEALIEKHLMGEIFLGAYTIRPDNTVTWMAFDVDSTDIEEARDITSKLSMTLSVPHIIEFSGRKGYHILIFFKKPVPAESARSLGEEIRNTVGARASGHTHVEIFPKQDKLTINNPLGNLLKLPLGIHPATGNRSIFVLSPIFEQDSPQDPLDLLVETTTLEDLAKCLEGYEDPIEKIVDTLIPFWVEGQRHDLSLYLAGWLATSGWEEEDALTIVEMLQQAAGGDLANQLQAVQDTYKKYANGGTVLGLHALTERLPGTALRNLATAIAKQRITPIITLIDGIRSSKGPSYLKSRSAASSVVSYLRERGKILVDQNTDRIFWLDRTSHHLYSMEDNWWDTILYNTFGLNTAENFGSSTARGIFHTARETAEQVRTHNRSWWDGDNLWLNLGGSFNYVLSGDSGEETQEIWGRKILNGEEGVIFRNKEGGLQIDLDRAWDAGTRPLNPWDFLVNDLNFGIGNTGIRPAHQRELIKAWFLSTFFPNVMPTRPLLTIVADPGAGKTTAARRFLYVLEGPTSDVHGVVTDKPDSLRASIASHKFIVLDNLEKSKSYWLVDMLNRVSTGTHIELRKLHTTNDIQRFIPDCFIILTATALPFAEESLFTRLLPVELATLRNPFPEYLMQRKILDNLNGIWMGILGMLNVTVRELRSVRTAPAPTESRLADFTVFCSRIQGLTNGADGILDGESLMAGLEMMTNRQKLLLTEASPMVSVLETWIREEREKTPGTREPEKWHSASELNSIFGRIAQRTHAQWIWETGHSLAKHIQALEPNLMRNYNLEVRAADNNNPKKYRFIVDDPPPMLKNLDPSSTDSQTEELRFSQKRRD